MSTSTAASRLLRLTNIPLHTLLRSGTTSTPAAATTTTAKLFTFNTTKPNPKDPEESKPNGHTETFILQPNGQNPFGFTAAVDQSKARILCRWINMPDDTATEYEDSYVESDDGDGDDDDDDYYDDANYSNDVSDSDDDDFRVAENDDEDIKPRKIKVHVVE